MTRVARTAAAVTAAAIGAALVRSPRLRHQLIRAGDVSARRVQRYPGNWVGLRYRLTGRHPDLDVDDAVLADRVRSTLGPLIKRLDLPHVHVMSVNHVVSLHGEVGDARDAKAIEDAVGKVSGVEGVHSYLHVGLLPSDTRPSRGRAEPSEQRRRLHSAARASGLDDVPAEEAVRAVLAAFGELVPAGERAHLLVHLAADVKTLLEPPRRHGQRPRVHTAGELVDVVAAEIGGVTGETAGRVTQNVLGELRGMVPEERADVAAVLPAELRAMWLGTSPR